MPNTSTNWAPRREEVRLELYCSVCTQRNYVPLSDSMDKSECWSCGKKTEMVPLAQLRRCENPSCRSIGRRFVTSKSSVDGWCNKCVKRCEECGLHKPVRPQWFQYDQRRQGRARDGYKRVCRECEEHALEEHRAAVSGDLITGQHRFFGTPGVTDF